MVLDSIKQFNWLDIFVLIILIRMGYIAIKGGMPQELFKLSGALLAVYLSMHYYMTLAYFIARWFGKDKEPGQFLRLFSFIFLAIFGYLVFVFLRHLFLRFFKMEATPYLNKWGGFVLGLGRAFLLISMAIFILAITPINYLKNSVTHSYSGKRFIKVGVATYSGIWKNLMSKFMTQEKFNNSILKVQENINL